MQKISRRDFGVRAAGVAAALAVPSVLRAQTPTPAEPDPVVTDAEIDDVQKKLAKPLSDDAKKILKADLVSQKKDTAARLKVILPEQSEPCFIFVSTPKRQGEKNEEGIS
jgi:hypothetical protein